MPVGYPTFAQIGARARFHLNEQAVAGGATYTDANLVEPVNKAYEDLQEYLALAGAKRMTKEDATLVLTQGKTKLAKAIGSDAIAFPADMVVPHKLWEKGTGTGERFLELVEQPDTLPDVDAVQRLRYWIYLDDEIVTLGATRSVDIKLQYEVALVVLGVGSDALIFGSLGPLSLMTAALVAHSRGASKASGELADKATREMRRLLGRMQKPRQRGAYRRRPYGWRRSGIYY